MENVKFSAGSIIFNKGDKADCLYLIQKGSVSIVTERDGKETELALLKKDAFFGEMGVIEGAPRSATAKAVSETELLKVTADNFKTFVETNASEAISLMQGLSKALRETTAELKEAQKIVADLTEVAPQKDGVWKKLRSIATSYREHFGEGKLSVAEKNKTKFSKGEYIFRKGDKADRLYRILTGEIALYNASDADNDKLIAVCKAGDIFGEMGVVEGERRSATAVSLTDGTELYAMANNNLESCITQYPDDALKILRNLSKSLRTATDKYVETLSIIDELIRADRSNYLSYPEWDRLLGYSEMYQDYAGTDPIKYAMMNTSFFGQW